MAFFSYPKGKGHHFLFSGSETDGYSAAWVVQALKATQL